MDDKVLGKFSRKVEYLVRKRHRMVKHIMNVLSKEGGFWMNCVFINKELLEEWIDPSNKQDLAAKFYSLAISFGRVVDLSNVVNTVYWLLQLFEEVNVFYFLKMNEDPVEMLWYPPTQQSFQQLSKFEQACIGENEEEEEEHDEDHSRKWYNKNDSKSKKLIKSIEKANKAKETALLPFAEQATTDYQTYFENTVQYDVEMNTDNLVQDVLKMFTYQHISYDMNLYEVSHSLMNILMLIYNKMYDNRCLNNKMFSHLEKVDNSIMSHIIEPLTDIIEEIAQTLMTEQFNEVINDLSFENIINKE